MLDALRSSFSRRRNQRSHLCLEPEQSRASRNARALLGTALETGEDSEVENQRDSERSWR